MARMKEKMFMVQRETLISQSSGIMPQSELHQNSDVFGPESLLTFELQIKSDPAQR